MAVVVKVEETGPLVVVVDVVAEAAVPTVIPADLPSTSMTRRHSPPWRKEDLRHLTLETSKSRKIQTVDIQCCCSTVPPYCVLVPTISSSPV